MHIRKHAKNRDDSGCDKAATLANNRRVCVDGVNDVRDKHVDTDKKAKGSNTRMSNNTKKKYTEKKHLEEKMEEEGIHRLSHKDGDAETGRTQSGDGNNSNDSSGRQTDGVCGESVTCMAAAGQKWFHMR